jgi:hypothetical protein
VDLRGLRTYRGQAQADAGRFRGESSDGLLERSPVDLLHRQVTDAAFVANSVDGGDIWVLQAGGGLCRPAEPSDPVRVSEGAVENLEGDDSVK